MAAGIGIATKEGYGIYYTLLELKDEHVQLVCEKLGSMDDTSERRVLNRLEIIRLGLQDFKKRAEEKFPNQPEAQLAARIAECFAEYFYNIKF